jgi:hypothetical protein
MEEWVLPTAKDVVEQLERMLASAYFRTAITQSNLLRFVVEKALANEPIKEAHIGEALFGTFDAENHKVRQNATLVRKKIEEFYADEGWDDLVRIDFLRGPAYRAVFTYHKNARALKLWQKAMRFKEYGSTLSFDAAATLFMEVIDLRPTYLPAYVELSEAGLLERVFGDIFALDWGAGTLGLAPYLRGLSLIRDAIAKAMTLDPENCRPHILLGALHVLDSDRVRAREEFTEALRLDASTTQSNLWYAAHLLVNGKTDEALTISEALLENERDNPLIRLAHMFFLYLRRDYERAAALFDRVPIPEHNIDLYRLLQTLIYLAKGQGEDALYQLEFISGVPNHVWGKFPHEAVKNRPRAEWFAGLHVLSLVLSGEPNEATQKLREMHSALASPPLQFAVAYMALGRYGRALAWLRRSATKVQISSDWIRMLPLFDPIRAHPRFEDALIESKFRSL